MACISEKLHELEFDIPSDKIWTHLKSMYNLESLDELEQFPFPNDEKEFSLPESEYGALKIKKEEKHEMKINTPKRTDSKDAKSTPVKELKKEDKILNKRDNTPRRDSKDGKEMKMSVVVKKEIKKEMIDKPKAMKSRSSSSLRDEEKSRTPVRQDEAKRLNKRPTRASIKPDDPGTPITRKSQSPLTVTPSSIAKRRRI